MATPCTIESRQEKRGLSGAPAHAFTLIELLVSMTVLSLLVVLVAQLTQTATNTTTLSTKQASSDDTARTVFNLMKKDFDGMMRRSDVDYLFYKNTASGATNPGNDSIWFYSDTVAYFVGGTGSTADNNKSPLAFVGYRIPTINNRPDSTGTPDAMHPNYVLERVAFPVAWMPAGTSSYNQYFLTRPAPTNAVPSPTPNPDGTFVRRYYNIIANNNLKDATYCNGDYRTSNAPTSIVSNEVFRMEFCFQMKDGSFMVPTTPDEMRKVGTDVSAVVVAIAILDAKSRVIVNDLTKAASALPDMVAADLPAVPDPTTATPPKLMAERWNAAINNPNFATLAGLPIAARSQVRVYQRTFYLGAR